MAKSRVKNSYRITNRQTVTVGPGGVSGGITPNPFLSLQDQYKQLAKQADQRLVRLEKLAKSDQRYANITKYSYAKAMRDIQSTFGTGSTRFNKKIALTANGQPDNRTLRKMIRSVTEFLNSPTSTKMGITSVYQHRADIINQKYGTNFTWEQLAKYFRSKAAVNASTEYGSSTFLYAIGKVQDDPEGIIDSIMESANDDIVTSNEKEKDEFIKEALKSAGVSMSDLKSKDTVRVAKALDKLVKAGAVKKGALLV